jgi:hypothetical protein
MANPRLLSDQAFAAASGLPGPAAYLVKLCLEHPVHPTAALLKEVHVQPGLSPTEATGFSSEKLRKTCRVCHRRKVHFRMGGGGWDSQGECEEDKDDCVWYLSRPICDPCETQDFASRGYVRQTRLDPYEGLYVIYYNPETGDIERPEGA